MSDRVPRSSAAWSMRVATWVSWVVIWGHRLTGLGDHHKHYHIRSSDKAYTSLANIQLSQQKGHNERSDDVASGRFANDPDRLPLTNKSVLPPLSAFPVTNIISLACVVVFLLCYVWDYWEVFEWLHFPELTNFEQVWQLWRWLTPAVFHFGVVHIVFNVIWWYLIGRIVEYCQGGVRLMILFIATALIPNFAQYAVGGTDFGGLSGVVYGLFGYVWVYGHLRPGEGLFMPMSVMIQILAWLILGFTGLLESWAGIRMANAAHLGGLLVGAFLALMYSIGPTTTKKM